MFQTIMTATQAAKYRCALIIAITLTISLSQSALAQIDIPLKVDVPSNITTGNWPVTFGVPFAKDMLQKGEQLIVTRNGQPVMTQTVPTAMWTASGDDVRWLLVDTQVSAEERDAEYRLVSGRNLPSTASRLQIKESPNDAIIDTGVAAFRINKTAPFAVTSITVGRQLMVNEDRPMQFYVTDHLDKTYYADGSDNFVVEDVGPARITIKSEGWFTASDGEQFCKHIIRLCFFANQTKMRVRHTFIYTGTTESHRIRDIAMQLPVSGAYSATFGTSAADPMQHTVVANTDAHLTQDCEHRHNLTWQLAETESGQPIATGEGETGKAGGWMTATGIAGSATIAMRDAWQNYPNEFEMRSSSAIVHFWPLHGRIMDFSTRAVLWPYGEDGIEKIDKFFLSKPKPYTKSIDDIYNNAMGVAKTHDLWVDFHLYTETKPVERAAQLVSQANETVLAVPDPTYSCNTRAIWQPIAPYSPDRFPHAENMLDAMFDRFVNWQKVFAGYGWYDYGDVHNGARDHSFAIETEAGPAAQFWRYWDSTHYGLPNCPWTLYFRSGKRKYYHFAVANARHCMDIDRCHFGNDDDRIKGTHYYCDWSIIHWNGAPPNYVWLTCYDKLEYMPYMYYMTGDRRALEVMKDWGEAAKRFHDDPDVAFPLKMLRPQFKNVRHLGPPLGNLTELYRLTWDDKYLQMARDYADGFIEMDKDLDDKTFNMYYSKLQFCWEGMLNYARLTNDPTFTKAMLNYLKRSAERGGHRESFADAAYLYDLTNDTHWLDNGKSRMMFRLASMNLSDDPDKRGGAAYWAAGNNPYAMRTLPLMLGAFMQAPNDWQLANLPLVKNNRTMHSAGPRHATIHFKRSGRDEPAIALQLNKQQAVTIHSPDGKAIRTVDEADSRTAVVASDEISSDWSQLRFALRPTRRPDNYIDYGNVNLLTARNVKLVYEPSTEDGKFTLMSPRIYFFVPSDVDEFTVTVQVSDTWAAFMWNPVTNIFDPSGKAYATKEGAGTITFTVKPDADSRGKCWSIGPIGRPSAPRETATWHKPAYPVDKHFPCYFTLSDNLPQFVSPHPELFELPAKP